MYTVFGFSFWHIFLVIDINKLFSLILSISDKDCYQKPVKIWIKILW